MQSKRTPLGDNIFKEHRESGTVITVKWTHPVTKQKMGPHVVPDATTKTEAKRWREERLDAIKQKRRFTEDESMTALAETWLAIREEAMEDGTLAPKTFHADSHAAATIKQWFGNVSASDVTTQKVREFNQGMKKGTGSLSKRPLAPKTRDSILGILSQMFARKIAENNGGFNPVSGLASTERSQRREREPIEMTLLQIKQLLLISKKKTPAYRPLFQLLALTGMRIEEALRLRWENLIVGENGADYLQVTNGKQRRAKDFKIVRLVPVSKEIKTMLVETKLAAPAWSSSDEDYVFSAGPGKHKSYRNVRRALRTVSEAAGYGPSAERHLHCHDFRHSLCVIVRPSLRTYAERLSFCRSMGWKDTTMFDRVYGQSRDEIEVMAGMAADVLLRAGVGA